MDNYTYTGYLTTDAQSWDAAAGSVLVSSVFDSTLQAIEITIEQDTDGDGTANNTETIALEGGDEDLALSAFEAVAGATYWVRVDLGSETGDSPPRVDALTLTNKTKFTASSEIVRKDCTLIEPTAGALTGTGSAVELMVDGVIAQTDHFDSDDAGLLSEEVYYQQSVGIPLFYEFDWQEPDTAIEEWPVSLTSTFAVHADDPSIFEDLEIAAMGEDCRVDVEVGDTVVDSATGLVLVSLDWTYHCPTNAVAEVTLQPNEDGDDTDPATESSASTLMTPPGSSAGLMGFGGSGRSGSGGSGSGSWWSYTEPVVRRATCTGAGCVPSNQSGRSHVFVTTDNTNFQSFDATLEYDSDLLQIDAIHVDDTIFAERNERSSNTWAHRMDSVTNTTIDNTYGYATFSAASDTAYRPTRHTARANKVAVTIDYTALGPGGTDATLAWTEGTFYDGNGAEITDPLVTHSGATIHIDNGFHAESANVNAGETTETAVHGNVGGNFDEFRAVMRFDPTVVESWQTASTATTSVETIGIHESRDAADREHVYAIVEGTFDTLNSMRDLFTFSWTAHTETALLEAIDRGDPYPSSTQLHVLTPADVQALNDQLAYVEGDWQASDPAPWVSDYLPADPLPEPYARESGVTDYSIGCANSGKLTHQSVNVVNETADGWEIPDFGVVYWPLTFEMIVRIPGVYPGSLSRDDIHIEMESHTNPGISYTVGELLEGSVIVPVMVAIPKADSQEYPVHFDFDMWIGGERVTVRGDGLHMGDSFSIGTHGPRAYTTDVALEGSFSMGMGGSLGKGVGKGLFK